MNKLSLTLAMVMTLSDLRAESFSLNAAGVESAVEKIATYSNQESGYSFEYPGNWIKRENLKSFDIFIVSPKNEQGHVAGTMSVISGEVGKDVDLEKFSKENIENLTQNKFQTRFKGSGTTTVGGHPSKWIRYTRQDHQVEILHYFLVVNNIGILITFGAGEEVFDQYEDIFTEMLLSFKFRD